MIEPFGTVELSDPAYERDCIRQATVKSRALGRRADVSLWIPDAESIGTLLILLHGVWGSHWVWTQKGGAHHTAQDLLDKGEIEPIVIAMPSDGLSRDGSGYLCWPLAPADRRCGGNVEAWIVDEVPALAHLAAPALRADARIAIAGLSMGGFGALRLGAKYASHFCAISAHSAITDVEDLAGFVKEPLPEYLACAPREQLEAAYWLIQNRANLPSLHFDCGTEDSLLDGNRKLHRDLETAAIPHIYREHAGGHEWTYWQRHLADTLRHTNHASRRAKP